MRANHSIWEAVRKEIASRITEHQYQTWFRSVEFDFSGPEQVAITVPNRFYRTFLKHRYLPVVVEAIETVTSLQRPRIEFQVQASDTPLAIDDAVEPTPVDATQLNAEPILPANLPLNDAYTFSQFVIGPSNRLAHAASVAVAESPGTTYNPLFIYGSVGLGKTHLMQAVAQTYLSRKMYRVVYLSCASFTNDFIAALRGNDLDSFRHKYRTADALLIDDIQFLAAKERTQDEFFHTFNSIYYEQKQIFLSSDCLPSEIEGLSERLVSRFKRGLVAQLDPPDFETRVAILLRKAENLGFQVPTDVAEYVSRRVHENIREIEGAVLRLHSLLTIERKPLNLDTVRDSLADLLGEGTDRVDLLKIQQAVLFEFDVSPADLHSRKRTRSVVVPRQICMYLSRKLTNHSLEEVGAYFGGRDHSTVIHAVEKIEDVVARDSRIRRSIEKIESRLGR